MRLGVGAALVDGRLVEGDVEVEGGVIAAVGLGPSWPGSVAVPGFVDAHINGVAGVDFLTADADGYREAAQALAATGVVAFQPTFISSPVEAYAAPLAAGRPRRDGRRRRPPPHPRRAPGGPVPLPPSGPALTTPPTCGSRTSHWPMSCATSVP